MAVTGPVQAGANADSAADPTVPQVRNSATAHAAAPTNAKQAFVPPPAVETTLSPVGAASGPATPPKPAPTAAVALAAEAPPDTSLASPDVALAADFSQLADGLGALIGAPLEAEQSFPDTCDTSQLTTTGLAYLVCSTGEVGFAALPDGLHHWALADGQLLEWIGPDLEPPWTAGPADLATCGDPTATYCRLAGDSTVGGYLQAAGATNAYQVMLSDPTRLMVSLTDLPADYDLYLVDGTGAIIGQSVNEGSTPESIDQVLAPGTYIVYVHVDPARDFAPDDPYQLTLTQTRPGIVEAPPSDDEQVAGNVIAP